MCACSDGFKADGNICVKQASPKHPGVSYVSFCLPEQFACWNRRCIPESQVCDGIDQCGDKSDEDASVDGPCKNGTCLDNQISCDNNTCISRYWLCDGEKDCIDGSDESAEYCSDECSSNQFKCAVTKQCIPAVWKCDLVPDCGLDDFSDEADCSARPCDLVEFTCKNGRCISVSMYCDGVDDCKDGSDELNCTDCEIGAEFSCPISSKCLPNSKRCDGVLDCIGGFDEYGCAFNGSVPCEPHEFQCTKTAECIPLVSDF